MTKSFFVKSWNRDLPLLEYLKRSIRKFAPSFFDEIVLLLPVGVEFEWTEARIERCRDLDPGYLGQQVFKCYADKLCRSDLIIFGDSDTIFTREITEEDFVKDGKPIWQYTMWSNAREDQRRTWLNPMADFVGTTPSIECMRRHCFAWPREFFDRLRAFCKFKHRQELVDYVLSRAPAGDLGFGKWSEFNCAGWFAREHEIGMFSWVKDEDARPSYVYQGHTHAGPERIKSDIEHFKKILGEKPEWLISTERTTAALKEADKGTHLEREWPERLEGTPADWRADATFIGSGQGLGPKISSVSEAIAFLVEQARKDGFAKGRILKQLKAAGLVKGGKINAEKSRVPALK